MLRRCVATLIALLMLGGVVLAADKTFKGTLLKVDVKRKLLVIRVEDEKKEYTIDSKTRFVGPRGGVSEVGIRDDRLKPGVFIELVVAGNNRTVREVRLPERKDRR